MTSTTTWHRAIGGSSLTLYGYVDGALDGWPGIDVEAVVDEFRDAINAALPDSVSLCGDTFYGPAGHEVVDFETDGYPVDEDGALDFKTIVESVDFWAIVQKHDVS